MISRQPYLQVAHLRARGEHAGRARLLTSTGSRMALEQGMQGMHTCEVRSCMHIEEA